MNDISPVTRCLEELRRGESAAFDRLVGFLYDDLHAIARRQLAGSAPLSTLNPTVLVHEAYLRLAERDGLGWQDRSHFLAACSVVMRNLVIDYARRRRARKRGGDRHRVTFDENEIRLEQQAEELLALDEALDRLRDYGDRLVRVVECRFFAGLTEVETAEALAISERTVRRDWIKARTLLEQLLEEGEPGVPG